jgi:hypothetical protein
MKVVLPFIQLIEQEKRKWEKVWEDAIDRNDDDRRCYARGAIDALEKLERILVVEDTK